MAKKILTIHNSNLNIKNYYYSLNLLTSNNEEYLNMYCFLSRINPWENESAPPDITYSDFNMKTVFKNMLVMKKILPSDISAVVERIDWVSGTVYDYYSDTINMFEKSSITGKLVRQFYVRNRYDQIFKCIWNVTDNLNPTGKVSTNEPSVTYGTSVNTIITTADGYKWKYLFTLDPTKKSKFFDENWIPVPILDNRKDLTDSTKGSGGVSAINITNSGGSYANDAVGNITTTVTISGDGLGATAKAYVTDSKISNILVTNEGSGYTYANITISKKSPYNGSGATAIASISPIGGDTWNLYSELGAENVMIICTFDDTENGFIPNDIDYRQIGLLINPNLIGGGYANSSIYTTTTAITVSAEAGTFIEDEKVYQKVNSTTETYQANVLNFDSFNNILYVINNTGTLVDGYSLYTDRTANNISKVCLAHDISDIEPFSGDIIYIENRQVIQRTPNGVEQFRLAIKI